MERERGIEGERQGARGREGRPSRTRGKRRPHSWAGVFALTLAPCTMFAAQVLSIEGVGLATSNYAVQLSEGDSLDAGRIIRTNSFATCTLGWAGSPDKVVIEPGSNAELVGENPTRLRLEAGKIRFTGKDVAVSTAGAIATSKQAGSYTVSLKEGKEFVEVREGEAAVTAGAKKEQYSLRGGEELEIGPDGSVKKGSIMAQGASK